MVGEASSGGGNLIIGYCAIISTVLLHCQLTAIIFKSKKIKEDTVFHRRTTTEKRGFRIARLSRKEKKRQKKEMLSCRYAESSFGCKSINVFTNVKQREKHELYCGWNPTKLLHRQEKKKTKNVGGGIKCIYCNSFALDIPNLSTTTTTTTKTYKTIRNGGSSNDSEKDEENRYQDHKYTYDDGDVDKMMQSHVHNHHDGKTSKIFQCRNYPACDRHFYNYSQMMGHYGKCYEVNDDSEDEREQHAASLPDRNNNNNNNKRKRGDDGDDDHDNEDDDSNADDNDDDNDDDGNENNKNDDDDDDDGGNIIREPILLDGGAQAKHRNLAYGCCFRTKGCVRVARKDFMTEHIPLCGFCPDDRTEWIRSTFGAKSVTEKEPFTCCVEEGCRWVLNDRRVQTVKEARWKKNKHDRDYHPSSVETPVEIVNDNNERILICGYTHCQFEKSGSKESKSEVRKHMKCCGYDDTTNIEERRQAFEGAGVCDVDGCHWVAKAKSGTFKRIQGIQSQLTLHKEQVHHGSTASS